MVWKKPKPQNSWRDYLTPEEAVQLAELERSAEEMDRVRSEVAHKRYLIANRATQRARYAEGKA